MLNLELHEIIDLCDGGGGMSDIQAARMKLIVLRSDWGNTPTAEIPEKEWMRMLDEATTATFSTVLAEMAEAFEQSKRDDGKTFYKLKDDAPEWLKGSDVMLKIHSALDDRFPDDWVYETAWAIAENLTGYDDANADDANDQLHEVADGLVDVYNSDRARWLALHLNNALLCDEAAEESGTPIDVDMFSRIGAGQHLAIERIGYALITAVDAELDERDD
jgi:hypothetical protein